MLCFRGRNKWVGRQKAISFERFKMSKKLFVGSLPFSTTSEELEELFGKFGKVESATIITDKYSGRSRGFGFVEMSEDKDADKAIKELNGSEIQERKIIVSEARPPRENREGYQSFKRKDF